MMPIKIIAIVCAITVTATTVASEDVHHESSYDEMRSQFWLRQGAISRNLQHVKTVKKGTSNVANNAVQQAKATKSPKSSDSSTVKKATKTKSPKKNVEQIASSVDTSMKKSKVNNTKSPKNKNTKSPTLKTQNLQESGIPKLSNEKQSQSVSTTKSPKVKKTKSPKVQTTKTTVKTTKSPKVKKTKSPTVKTTKSPKVKKTKSPTVKTTKSPKVIKTSSPTAKTTISPSLAPSSLAQLSSRLPTVHPSPNDQTYTPTQNHSGTPSMLPSLEPTVVSSTKDTLMPSFIPSMAPSFNVENSSVVTSSEVISNEGSGSSTGSLIMFASAGAILVTGLAAVKRKQLIANSNDQLKPQFPVPAVEGNV